MTRQYLAVRALLQHVGPRFGSVSFSGRVLRPRAPLLVAIMSGAAWCTDTADVIMFTLCLRRGGNKLIIFDYHL